MRTFSPGSHGKRTSFHRSVITIIRRCFRFSHTQPADHTQRVERQKGRMYQHSAPRPSFLSVGGIITAAGVSYAGHLYGQFDRRDTDADERRKAQRCLNILSGHACTSNAKGSTLSRHVSNLDRYGVTHIRSVLSPASAEKWDATVARQVAKKELGGCIVPAGGALGRTHCRLPKRTARQRANLPEEESDRIYDEMVKISEGQCPGNGVRAVESGKAVRLKDIAAQYFASKGIATDRFDVVQLQLLLASPKSTHQVWHRDNVSPGLTVLIALRDVVSNGPTEIILRSHRGNEHNFWGNVLRPNYNSSFAEDELVERILLASIDKGDAIMYDSRCLHRGRGYGESDGGNDQEATDLFGDRPVLVIRFDAKATPAPGTGLVGNTLAKWEGSLLAFACTMLTWLGL